MAKKIKLEAECSDEFTDSPGAVQVELDDFLVGEIKRLQKIVKDNNLLSATVFHAPKWLNGMDSRSEFKTAELDCNELVVSDDDIQWQALIAGTSIVIKSYPYPISKIISK